MKIDIKTIYNKRSNRGKSPATFTARQPNGVGTDIKATVRLDPILKKHADLKKLVMKHEVKEITHWGKGSHIHVAHNEAAKGHKHIKDTRDLWKIIDRRKAR